MDKDGNVFFADPASNRIYKSDAARTRHGVQGEHRRRAGASRWRGRPPVRHTAVRQAARVCTALAATRRSSRRTSTPTISPSPRAARSTLSTRRRRPSAYIVRKGQRRVVYNGGEIMSPTALTLTPDQAMLLVATAWIAINGRFRSRRMDRWSTASRSSVWKCPKKGSSAESRSHRRLHRLHVGDQRGGDSGLRATGPVFEHPEQARVHSDADYRHRVRRT